MKVSIITPTYNDSSTISETIESIYNQNYDNWEWIVINDGSTDDTEDVIKKKLAELGIEDKCTYIYQKNADQLNAVIAGIEYITGEYVFVLHSDDLLPDDEFLERCVAYMKDHDEIDGIFGDLVLIDSKNTIIGSQYIRKYEKTENNNALLLLWLGRNLYSDVAFHKTSSYITAVKYNYLNWNMPLWIDFRNGIVSNLNYSSVDWPLLKYRIHEGNYINNRLGKMNVINGEIRTAIELMKFYEIPFYKLQYIIFRILNKIKKNIKYHPLYLKKETKNKYKILKYIVDKRYGVDLEGNSLLESLLAFYTSKSARVLNITKVPNESDIYYGKDIRLFNTKIIEGNLEPFYKMMLEEMKEGFREIHVANVDEELRMKDILKFLCIDSVSVRSKA